RFDLLKLDRYSTATLQFSRGCPYVCEFCDIIVMFGRRPRTKPWPQVERELDALFAQGVRNVFFVDDNLIGHRPAAKALLRELVAWQARHGAAFRFGTEVSINLAQDAELLSLMREAGFVWVFVGIESADPQTLKDTGKTQNTHQDVLTSIRAIYGHGIDVLGGFIVGFDNDTAVTFDVQHRFIVDSGIQAAMVGLLTALPKTPLHARLESEGRLREARQHSDNTKLSTNVVPKRMSYDEMIEGYRVLYQRLLSDEGIAARIRNKLRHLEAPVYAGEYALRERVGIVARLLAKGIVPGGPRRVLRFLGTIPWRSPRKFPLVIVDWIAGLAMRDYALRHLRPLEAPRAAVDRGMARLRRALEAPAMAGRAVLSLRALEVRLSLSLDASAGRRFFDRLARRLEALLRLRGTTVMLDFERLVAHESRHVERLLARLARHGDRVFIVARGTLHETLAIDWSRFNVVLRGDAA
ncbi:MAG: B12-binding domain-containing radical SAM protein, partial [Burkholderiales bacterium]|nr:B12-binding domain-containing radical SAM protein [Burkholderiales bacterium]